MKKAVKKFIAALLATVMSLGLAACAPAQSAEKAEPEQSEAQLLAAQSTEMVLSGEYVYVSEYLPLAANEQEHISPRAYTDEGFYTVEFEKLSGSIPEDAEESSEEEDTVYESRLRFTGFDGSVRELEKFESTGAPENTEGLADFSSGADMGGLAVAPDGTVFLVENCYYSWYDGPAGLSRMDAAYWNHQRYASEYYLRHLDSEGAEISRAKLQLEGEYVHAHSIKCDGDGNVLMLSDSDVRVYSPEGVELGRIACESYPDSIVSLSDGRSALSYWNSEGDFVIAALDMGDMSLEELYTLPGAAYSLTAGAGEYDLFYINGSAFYGVKSSDGSHEKLFNWINCDVSISSITSIKSMDDGSFITVSNEYRPMGGEDYVYEAGIITIRKIPVEYAAEKTVLSFATIYLDQEASDMIADFNRSNEEYRIEVKDYFEYNTEDDFSIGVKRLVKDLEAGNAAYIIDLDGLPYELLASRGLLEDLYPYIERDEELSKEDFFASVLSALEVDGKLCSTVGGFSVNTLLASELAVADNDGWTYEQLYGVLGSMPEGCEVFDVYTSSADVLRDFLPFELVHCIDWKSGECSFNNDSFLALMNFAAAFPSEFDWENYIWNEADSSEYRLSRGIQLLTPGTLHTFDDANYSTAFFGTGVNYVGYPSHDGEFRSSLIPTHRYAMNASASNKDGAWSFLRRFLSEEHQSKNVWNFPARLDVYQQWQEKAMKATYMTDEQGELVLDENGAPIVLPTGKMGGIQGTVIDIYPITQSQADKLRQLINSADTFSDTATTEKIAELLIEEATRFFNGEVSAETAAENMNTKVSEYLVSKY